MSKVKSKGRAPALPTAANAEAFIRNDAPAPPSAEPERVPVMIKLPAALHRRLKVKLAEEGLTFQQVGERHFRELLGEADA